MVWRPCLALLLAGVPALAVSPAWNTTVPAGAPRGTELEITLRGERLADAREILAYQPGIEFLGITAAEARQVRVRLRVAADCPLGEHLWRLRTDSGLSALRKFWVDPLPVVAEREPNRGPGEAQRVRLGVTVTGTLTAEDEDWFEVEAKQGQRLALEVVGARLGRTLLDPRVTIQDATGRILAKATGTRLLGNDAALALEVPADGIYRIQLRDAVHAGPVHDYRLHVGDFRRPLVAYPPGGPAGAPLAVEWLEETGPVGRAELRLPAAPAERVAWEAAGAPSPVFLRVAPFPDAPAVAPGRSLQSPARLGVAAPFALHGRLAAAGEAHFHAFRGTRDQHLELRILARRLGSPLDPVLTVHGPKGNILGTNDDAAGHPDSLLRLRLPEDGEYTVKVADHLGQGGPARVYRLEVTEVRPQPVLSIPDTARYDYETRKSLAVPRGNRLAILVNVARDGLEGDLRLSFPGLPEGIEASPALVPAGVSAVPVVFSAAAEAPLAGRLVAPMLLAGEGGANPVEARFRHTVDWVRIQNDTVYTRSEVDRLAAAVVEAVPFRVELEEPAVPLVQGGELDLKVAVRRDEGFGAPVTLKLVWAPPGVTAQPEVVVPAGATEAEFRLTAGARAEARRWPIVLTAAATVGGGLVHVGTIPVDLMIAAPFLVGRLNLAKLEAGGSGRFVCTLEPKAPFPGEAELELFGLPEGVAAAPVRIAPDAREAVFEVTATPVAPRGLHRNVGCRLRLRLAAGEIIQTVATGGTLRIDAPRVAAAERRQP
jgi:hypothetical protein